MNQTVILKPGEAVEGGFYAGAIRVGADVYGIVVAPKALGEFTGAWQPTSADVPGALSTFDGLANTEAMADAGSEIAKAAKALTINGYGDWYIPSRDELEVIYRNLKPTDSENYCTYRDGDNPSSEPPGHLYTAGLPAQTEAADFREGGDQALDPVWHWSSTQYSAVCAYTQDFSDGNQYYDGKGYKGRARAVRRFKLNA